MVTDDRQPTCCPTRPSRTRNRGRGAALPIVIATLAVALSATMLPFLLVSQGQESPRLELPPQQQDQLRFQSNERLFNKWPKPDVAIVISGQMIGYLQPCGCSEPQLGGLARRYNFLQTLTKGHGWNVVLADVGDVPQASGPQAVLKYKTAMNALKLMDYTATSFGKNEMGLGLLSLLGEFALNDPQPRVLAANLEDRDTNFGGMVGSGTVSRGPGPKVGFIAFVDKNLLGFPDPDVKLEVNVNKAIQEAMQQKAFQEGKPELLVLLFQGKLEDAKKIASSPRLPKFDAIVIPIEEEDPSAQPIKIGKTMIFSAGQKGRHVGVLGAFRTTNQEQPFELRYQLVEIGPQYETPKGQDASNPIHALLQDYAQSVKNKNLLAEFTKNPSKHPTQLHLPGSTYVGSDKCKNCHDHAHAYKVWANSAHSHAYDSLVQKAVRPTLRQFDGECVRCHVTGFGYESGFVDANATPKLKNVGCEACHGPASQHVLNPNNVKIHEIINPWKHSPKVKALQGNAAQQMKLTLIGDSCAVCHDLDNSVNFKIEKYWKMIEHPTPQVGE